MIKKKGQAIIFFILGIIILSVIIISSILIKSNTDLKITDVIKKRNNIEEAQLNDINNYILSCLDISAKESIYKIMRQGGYAELPLITNYTFIETPLEDYDLDYNPYSMIPYYILQGNKTMPTIKEIEESIGKKAKVYFIDCINNFSMLETNLFKLDYLYGPEILVSVKEKKVFLFLNYELMAKSVNSEYKIGPYNKIIDYDLNSKYYIAELFVNQQLKDLKFIDVGYLSWLAHKNNFRYEISEVTNNTYSINFIYDDYKNIYSDHSLIHSFMIEYK